MKNRICRPMGRFFYWPILIALVALWSAGPAMAAAPAKTIVQDTIYRADGTVAAGTLLISWPAFTTVSGDAVAAGSMNVKIGANGAVSIALVPNTGSTPASSYKVTLRTTDGVVSEEYWTVPAIATTTIGAIRSKVATKEVATQFVGRDYVDTKLAQVQTAVPADVVRSSSSYTDPSWLNSLAASKVTGSLQESALPAIAARTNATNVWSSSQTDQALHTFSAGVSTTLINNVAMASGVSGSDACAKITSAAALLPATGGTVDARGFQGAQACGTDPFNGVTVPMVLLLDEVNFSTQHCWRPHTGQYIVGKPADYQDRVSLRGTILTPMAGSAAATTENCGLSYDAATDSATAGFITQVGASGISVDARNVGANANFKAIALRAVSNTGPWENLAVFNQSCGNSLYLGPSSSGSAPSWNLADGTTIDNFYTLHRSNYIVANACNADPIALLENVGEVHVTGARTKFEGRGETLAGSVAMLVRANGSLSNGSVSGPVTVGPNVSATGAETGFKSTVINGGGGVYGLYLPHPNCEGPKYCVYLDGTDAAHATSGAVVSDIMHMAYTGSPAYGFYIDRAVNTKIDSANMRLAYGGAASGIQGGYITANARYGVVNAPASSVTNLSTVNPVAVMWANSNGTGTALTMGSGTETAPHLIVDGGSYPGVSWKIGGVEKANCYITSAFATDELVCGMQSGGTYRFGQGGNLFVNGQVQGATLNATGSVQVNGVALAASHLSNGTTGSGAVVLTTSPTLAGATLSSPALTNATLTNPNIGVASGTSLDLGKVTLSSSGTVTKYNNVTTKGAGIGAIFGSVSLTAQGAAISATNLYTATAGLYRVCYDVQVTRAATTSSSVAVTIGWNNGGAQTKSSTAIATNVLNAEDGNCYVVNSTAANITYTATYSSSGGTSMQYALRVTAEQLQ